MQPRPPPSPAAGIAHSGFGWAERGCSCCLRSGDTHGGSPSPGPMGQPMRCARSIRALGQTWVLLGTWATRSPARTCLGVSWVWMGANVFLLARRVAVVGAAERFFIVELAVVLMALVT